MLKRHMLQTAQTFYFNCFQLAPYDHLIPSQICELRAFLAIFKNAFGTYHRLTHSNLIPGFQRNWDGPAIPPSHPIPSRDSWDGDRISRDDPGIGIDFSSRHPASIPLFRENIFKIFQTARFNWIKDF